MINVKTATTAELVAFYNQHADKQVKKFQDRATAEARVTQLIATLTPVAQSNREAGEQDGSDVSGFADHGLINCPGFGAKTRNGRAAKNNDGVRKSWELDHVRAARSARHGVKVEWTGDDGVLNCAYYKSTFQAFVALGLPLTKCGAFRAKLKKVNTEVFSTYMGDNLVHYHFAVC